MASEMTPREVAVQCKKFLESPLGQHFLMRMEQQASYLVDQAKVGTTAEARLAYLDEAKGLERAVTFFKAGLQVAEDDAAMEKLKAKGVKAKQSV